MTANRRLLELDACTDCGCRKNTGIRVVWCRHPKITQKYGALGRRIPVEFREKAFPEFCPLEEVVF